jgi:hypothetical protein
MRAIAETVPRYSEAAFRGFELAFRPWQSRKLLRTPITGLPSALPRDRPLLLIANHMSWWDGFLLRDVHRVLRPGAPMYTVMSARELRRFPFLRLLGGTPLQESPAGLLSLLRGLERAVQKRPDATVVFFPQGRIRPSWARPLGFRRGVELLTRFIGPCYVLPVGLHIEPLNAVAPAAFTAIGRVLDAPGPGSSAAALEAAVTGRLDALALLLSAHGENTVQHLGEMS